MTALTYFSKIILKAAEIRESSYDKESDDYLKSITRSVIEAVALEPKDETMTDADTLFACTYVTSLLSQMWNEAIYIAEEHLEANRREAIAWA